MRFRRLAVLEVELPDLEEEFSIVCEVDEDEDRVTDQYRVSVQGQGQPAYFNTRAAAFASMATVADYITQERLEVNENAKR